MPLPGLGPETSKGLGVEELVGKNNERSLKVQGISETADGEPGEGVESATQESVASFGADFDKGPLARCSWAGQELETRFGDQIRKHGAQALGGVEVMAGSVAHS